MAKGVVYRTGDKLSAYAAVSCYNNQLNRQLRVAAHSALELFGFNHYVPMGKPILMVAYSGTSIPKWMIADYFDRTIKPFETNMFTTIQTSTVKVEGVDLLVSSPEQAFMECLLLASDRYGYMDLYYIMEQLTSLRADVVQTLLETIKNLRVKRMFLYMAEKAGHYWFEMLDMGKIDIGTSKLQLVENGIYISKYKITVPKDMLCKFGLLKNRIRNWTVTGGAIKLTKTMQDKGHTLRELNKLNACKEFLKRNSVFDKDSFIDLNMEE